MAERVRHQRIPTPGRKPTGTVERDRYVNPHIEEAQPHSPPADENVIDWDAPTIVREWNRPRGPKVDELQ